MVKATHVLQDCLGATVSKWDIVLLLKPNHRDLVLGIVDKVNPKMVRCEVFDYPYRNKTPVQYQHPRKLQNINPFNLKKITFQELENVAFTENVANEWLKFNAQLIMKTYALELTQIEVERISKLISG